MAGSVGIKEVAQQAGVSVGTVSNVINRPENVSEQTRVRVLAVIERLGYVRSESARQLRAGQSRIISLLVLDMANPFFVDVASGAERAAREAGLWVMLCNSAQSPGEEAGYLSLFAEQRVRGVLVTPVDGSGRELADFRRRGTPVVFVDRAQPSEEGCSVSVDDVMGGGLAVRHLLEQGHRDIAYISGPMRLTQCQDRYTGALGMIERWGLPRSRLRHIETGGLEDTAGRDAEAGRDAAARLLGMSPRPTAVFCANDLLALGVLQVLYGAGVSVPEEIALVGYDDIEFASAAAVPLTSVRQPAQRMGRIAAELLMEETGDAARHHRHQQIVLRPELVVRGSSVSGGPKERGM
ncbi:LacI family transcriptional regulator [Streptomyces sp. N2-109]|uniref:LacI family transcriptional regulator n=1 Tax=Streptomyces gossypii TaxID=2883101 RepID=A0ABT2JLR1_9ACTN|nr:LacI family DNA-binding transcriptional regulator [Streptomyces gossypii]MCT2588822.1 LacI family transcriptional regulator [Streptomyces gossypii]